MSFYLFPENDIEIEQGTFGDCREVNNHCTLSSGIFYLKMQSNQYRNLGI